MLEQAVQQQLKTMTTRRRLLRGLLLATTAPLAAAWVLLGRARRRRLEPRSVTLSIPDRDGVTFAGEVILVRDGDALLAMSARCPHLGCRINQLGQEGLVCPCHGSRFSADGTRLAGPATTNLTPLRVTRREGEERIDVELPT